MNKGSDDMDGVTRSYPVNLFFALFKRHKSALHIVRHAVPGSFIQQSITLYPNQRFRNMVVIIPWKEYETKSEKADAIRCGYTQNTSSIFTSAVLNGLSFISIWVNPYCSYNFSAAVN